jgi:hypothetical protein
MSDNLFGTIFVESQMAHFNTVQRMTISYIRYSAITFFGSNAFAAYLCHFSTDIVFHFHIVSFLRIAFRAYFYVALSGLSLFIKSARAMAI